MYVDLEVMDRFEELECIISNASSIPFSHKSGIDKEEVLELINNIKASLPEELKQAHWVNQERHKIINDSKQEALEIVEQAKKEAERIKEEYENNIEELKENSKEEYELLKTNNIYRLVSSPLKSNGQIAGIIGVDNPPIEKIQNIASLLETLCYFISLSIKRNQAEEELSRLIDKLMK